MCYAYKFKSSSSGELQLHLISSGQAAALPELGDDVTLYQKEYFLDPALISGNNSVTITATIPNYTVTWKSGDTVLKTDVVKAGTIPVYTGEMPTKSEADDYTYTFTGWGNETGTYEPDSLPPVTGNVTYEAQFSSVPKPGNGYYVIELIEALPELQNVTIDNETAIINARNAYDALTDEQKAQIPCRQAPKADRRGSRHRASFERKQSCCRSLCLPYGRHRHELLFLSDRGRSGNRHRQL